MGEVTFFGYPAKLVVLVDGEEVEIEKFLKLQINGLPEFDIDRVLAAIHEHEKRVSPAYYKVGTYPRRFYTREDAVEFGEAVGDFRIDAFNKEGKLLP